MTTTLEHADGTKETVLSLKDSRCFRAIEINDPHLAATSPPAFKVDYLEYVTDQLTQVFRAAINHNVDCILWGGDLFHLKEPRNNPHWLVARTMAMLHQTATEGKLIHLGIGGNHDYKYGSLETGLRGQPLEVILESRVMTLLDRHEFRFLGEGIHVKIAGGSYHHGRAEHVRDKKKGKAKTLITLGHFWLGTQTGEFFGEQLFGHDFFKDSEADIICVGHHHEDKGVHEAFGKTFISQGSVGITGAHPHDLTRRPAAALIEIDAAGTSIKMLRPKAKPITDLIDTERREQLKKERDDVDEFITTLARTQLEVADPLAILAELAQSQEVRERALEYIAQAEQK